MKELKMTPKILTWGIRRLNGTLSWESQELLVVKNLPDNVGDIRDPGLIPGSGRSPGGRHSNPLQYSCLENPMDRRGWWATVHRVTKSWMWLKWLSMHARTHVHTIPAIVHIKPNYLSSFWWTQLRCWQLLCVLLAPPEDLLKDRAEEEASPISKVSSPFLPWDRKVNLYLFPWN